MAYSDICFRDNMIFYNGMRYPFPFTNAQVRMFVQNLDYWYSRYNEYSVLDKNYENTDIPNQAFSFYLFIVTKRRIPSLSEYVQYYFKEHCTPINDNYFKFKPKYWTGILEHGQGVAHENLFPITACVGRLARAYPTFLREIELFTRIQDAGCRVQYSFHDDCSGIDLKILGDTIYSVKEFVATKNSLKKLAEKDVNSRARYKEELIYLPLHMSNTYGVPNFEIINNIYIYDQSTGDYLIGLSKGVAK